jgi:hypothetical protein
MVFAVPRGVRTADVVAAAVRHGGRLVGCRRDDASLEEVFEHMTRPRT